MMIELFMEERPHGAPMWQDEWDVKALKGSKVGTYQKQHPDRVEDPKHFCVKLPGLIHQIEKEDQLLPWEQKDKKCRSERTSEGKNKEWKG